MNYRTDDEMNGWRSVKDNPPKFRTKVIVGWSSGDTDFGYLSKEGTWHAMNCCVTNAPLYWQPSPELPKLDPFEEWKSNHPTGGVSENCILVCPGGGWVRVDCARSIWNAAIASNETPNANEQADVVKDLVAALKASLKEHQNVSGYLKARTIKGESVSGWAQDTAVQIELIGNALKKAGRQ